MARNHFMRPGFCRVKLLSVVFLLLALAFVARAHDPGLSTLKLQRINQQIHATLVFATTDIDAVVGIDKNEDGTVSADEFGAAREGLNQLAENLLEIFLDENALPVLETKCFHDTNNNFQIDLAFAPSPGTFLKAVSKWVLVMAPGHRQFVSFQEGDGPAVTEDLLDQANYTFTTDLLPESTPIVTTGKPDQSFSKFFVLGIEHILTGYDHLLFLFALLIVCESFVSVAKIVTCFTLAHSLTLVLATFDVVNIPDKIVEPVIAASIVYVGVENVFRRGDPKWRWLLTFIFGLVHGFGFAGVLRELGIGQSGTVAMPLVSFNLGVEFGQICIAAIVLPILWRLKKISNLAPRWVPACSILVAAAGAYWFIERVWF